MVRKGNQHKNVSLEKEKSKGHSQNTVDTGERVISGNSKRNKNKQRQQRVPCKEKSVGTPEPQQTVESLSNVQNAPGDYILFEDSEGRQNDGVLFGSNHNPNLYMSEGLSMETMAGHIRSSVTVAGQRLRVLTLDVLTSANRWFEQQKPRVLIFKMYICNGRDYILVQIKHVYPFIWTWIKHFGQLVLLLSVVWLDCNIRGISSLLRLGTTSFFTVIWCSILSIVSMVGFTKALIVMVISAVVGLFIGLALGVLILAIFSAISLWLYGSFWTTLLITCVGGSSFAMSHERVALLITTTYSVYCAKCYVGWLGLLLGLNLSFISSDILAYFLKNNINEQGQGSYYSSEQDKQTPTGAGHFYGEPSHSSSSVDDSSASRSSAVPSTSGCDAELTSEGEVLRLLNCNDHYSAFGITRFENVDTSLLKREYKKKAMLVHPDKNMGNEKAAEAFKKLQNAYEVLLDTLKRKTYDDELRREELLNYIRRFQGASSKTGKHNIFGPGSTHFEADDEGNPEESRRIACKNCGNFHKWTHTGRSKSQARWCQDCNDFHQAKDGDGWLEQSAHPFLFGLLQKVDAPCAYVCAEGRIYNATEWFICQGMRCPANTHRASFHVNTNLSSKHNSSNAKGASSSQRGSKPMPNNNIDESMTEEELFDWLQSAMQSGIFEANGGSMSESPTAKNGGSPKGGSSVKKKRKGKKQW